MPLWPCQYTGGVLPTRIFSPCWDTSQTAPPFSVISMRPSGRKASRQGSSKVATVVMVKGRLASGFCSPILTWAQAAAGARVKSNVAFANFIAISPCYSSIPDPEAGDLELEPVPAAPDSLPGTSAERDRTPKKRYSMLSSIVLYTRQMSRMQDTAPRGVKCTARLDSFARL